MRARRGFTLIEFLVYAGVISMITMAFISFSLNFTNARLHARARAEVYDNTRLAATVITQRARRASGFAAGSALGVNLAAVGATVGFTLDGAAENPTQFRVSGGVLEMLEGGGPAVALTTADTEVTDFVVTNLSSADGKTKHGRFTMSLRYKNPSQLGALTASTTVATSFELRDP